MKLFGGKDDNEFNQKVNANKTLVFYVPQNYDHHKVAKHESCELWEAVCPCDVYRNTNLPSHFSLLMSRGFY